MKQNHFLCAWVDYVLNVFTILRFSLALFILVLAAVSARADDLTIDVQLEGVPADKKTVLLSGLSINQQQISSRLSKKRIQQLHSSATAELQQILAIYGYYNVDITSTLTQAEWQWRANYQITLGPQVTLSQVNVILSGDGQQDERFQILLSDFPLKPGDPFNHENYESATDQSPRKYVF